MIAKATLIGRIGREPEVKAGNVLVARFSVAVGRKVKGEDVTDWHNVTAFGKQAEFVEKYLGKGRLVCVMGSLEIQRYTGKDGTEKTAINIIADTVQGLDKPPAQDGDRPGFARNNEAAAPAPRKPAPYDPGDDDIPF
jgi:single-strand DNA-binding protein